MLSVRLVSLGVTSNPLEGVRNEYSSISDGCFVKLWSRCRPVSRWLGAPAQYQITRLSANTHGDLISPTCDSYIHSRSCIGLVRVYGRVQHRCVMQKYSSDIWYLALDPQNIGSNPNFCSLKGHSHSMDWKVLAGILQDWLMWWWAIILPLLLCFVGMYPTSSAFPDTFLGIFVLHQSKVAAQNQPLFLFSLARWRSLVHL